MNMRLLLVLVAFFCASLSFAQEFMVIEKNNGGTTKIDVSNIKQVYFNTETPTDPEPRIEPAGSGTKEDPYNIAGIIEFTKALGVDIPSTEEVYFKGIISEIQNEYVSSYGNASFYVMDEADARNRFLCYRILYLGNKKFTEDKTQIKKGDEVIICGKVINYHGNTPETVSNGAYLYSLNGVIEGDGESDGVDTPSAEGDGTESNPFNVAAAIAAGSGTNVFVKGYIVGWIEGYNIASGAHFNANDVSVVSNILIANSPNETDVTNCMPVQLPSGAIRSTVNLQDNASNLKKEIILVGNIERYFSVTGIKGTSYVKIGDTEAGTKPGVDDAN